MKWFVGVDGGGTKTAFAVSTANSIPVAKRERSGCSYQTIGIDGAITLVANGVRECLTAVGADLKDCAGCCIGMPCYGEHPENDRAIEMALRAALAPATVYVTNDVEVGWAGSLECQEGIHLVAGTGSIAFGRGNDERTARCGGWNEFFGDEGSCYWIGREAMSTFSKEADGRLPKGMLYDVVCQGLGLTEKFHFTDVVLRNIAPYREQVARFQLYARQAAEAGDPAAIALYVAAARELALMVSALKKILAFSPGAVSVSYSGGLFKAGELILRPLQEEVEAFGCTLREPKRSAIEGALILAIEQLNRRNEQCF